MIQSAGISANMSARTFELKRELFPKMLVFGENEWPGLYE